MHRLDAILAKLGEARPDAASAEAAEGSPQAAVAAILRQPSNADSAELFFIQRAEDPKDPWSGHIAFPGGRRDPGDASLLHTAIRETREEVGLDLGPGDLVARLPDVPAFIRSKRGVLVVSPFVFVMRSDVAPTLNREVATTLWVPMATFARGEGRGTYAFTWEDRPYELPCFRLEPGQKVLWGMTYRMVETMLEAIGLARVG